MHRLTLLVPLASLAWFCSACADVAPYQRGRLAHATMEPSDSESVGRTHMQGVHEGAIGGTPGAASGCGCN